MATVDGQLVVSALTSGKLTELDLPQDRLSKYGRSPALGAQHAYWITPQGSLVRAHRGGGSAEELAQGARSGSRVSVLVHEKHDLVAFLKDHEDSVRAYLWTESSGVLQASEDQTGASSVAWIPGHPHPALILLEGRSGMSPVHRRVVRVAKQKTTLAPDEVIWVGPGSQPLTELRAFPVSPSASVVLLATSSDVSHFGLAHFLLTADPGPAPAPEWLSYPNGIDPAPVATTALCGKPLVFYVRPSGPAPKSPQELHVAELGPGNQLLSDEVLVRSRAFNDVSASEAKGGGVLSYTADRRTWGSYLPCR